MSRQKIAIVTGGSRGLGRDMAIQLAKKGLDVVVTYNSRKDAAEEVVSILKSYGVKAALLSLDVSKADSFVNFKAELSNLLVSYFCTDNFDYLINNAGTALHSSFMDTTMPQFDDVVSVHLKAPFFLSQQLLSIMNDGGGIINISSGLARFSFAGYAAYAAAKAAIETLSRYMAKELGSRKIRVNVVAPGAIATDFGGGAVRDNADLNAMISSVTALGRVGLPTDIGSVVAFLCTDDAGWVNAQRIEVSGGMML